MGSNAELYDADFYTWCLTTAALIRAGKWHDIDPESVAEELASVGHQEQEKVESLLQAVLSDLLIWWAQPEERCGRWRSTIRGHRHDLLTALRDSPSLQTALPTMIAEEYPLVRAKALEATRLYILPESCPFTSAQIVDIDFWPEGDTLAPEDVPR